MRLSCLICGQIENLPCYNSNIKQNFPSIANEVNVQKVILFAAMLLLICGVGLSYLDKTGGATVTYTAAVFCLIFAFLPKFKRFKGLGVEAELLEKKIEEADVILGHLRSLSVPLAELLFTMVARLGRWNSAVPRRDRYRILGRFEDALRGLGVPDAELSKAKSEWHRYNLIDQARPIVQSIHKRLNEKVDDQRKVVDDSARRSRRKSSRSMLRRLTGCVQLERQPMLHWNYFSCQI